MDVKVAIMIMDYNLNPASGINKYCVGRDRGGRVYAPIWFKETYIPPPQSLWWIRKLPDGSWILDHPVINHRIMDGLEIGDRKISAGNKLIFEAPRIYLVAEEETIYCTKIDMQNNKITNLALPTQDTDAANKYYVDSVAGAGGSGAPHARAHESGGADEVYFSQLERSSSDSTTHDNYTSTPHVSATEKNNWDNAYNHSQDNAIHLTSIQKTDLTDGGDCAIHKHDDRYYTETESDSRYSQIGHDHDNRYYTETESDARYSQINHNHDERYYTESESDSRYSQINHAHYLDDLADVEISNPSNGQALAYNSSIQKWVPQTIAGEGGSPGGIEGSVQFNHSNALSGTDNFSYSASAGKLFVPKEIFIGENSLGGSILYNNDSFEIDLNLESIININGGLSFTGSDSQYAAFQTSETFTTEISLECWINPNSSMMSGWHGIMGLRHNNYIPAVLQLNNGYAEFGIYLGSWYYITGSLVTSGSWNHIVATWKSGDKMRIYVNGVKTEGSIYSGSIPDNNSYYRFFGGNYGYSGRWCYGILDEVRFYNKQLSDAEVSAHYNSGQGQYGSPETGLVAGFHLDEKTGITASDYSGHNYNATLYGNPIWASGKINHEEILILQANVLKSSPSQIYSGGEHELGNINGLLKLIGKIEAQGAISPYSLSDEDAPNNSIYFSSTQGKLVYKDSSGTVNLLY